MISQRNGSGVFAVHQRHQNSADLGLFIRSPIFIRVSGSDSSSKRLESHAPPKSSRQARRIKPFPSHIDANQNPLPATRAGDDHAVRLSRLVLVVGHLFRPSCLVVNVLVGPDLLFRPVWCVFPEREERAAGRRWISISHWLTLSCCVFCSAPELSAPVGM